MGLERGGCYMHRTDGSVWCYYHGKLARELCEPFEPTAYPVFPLPPHGYDLVVEAA